MKKSMCVHVCVCVCHLNITMERKYSIYFGESQRYRVELIHRSLKFFFCLFFEHIYLLFEHFSVTYPQNLSLMSLNSHRPVLARCSFYHATALQLKIRDSLVSKSPNLNARSDLLGVKTSQKLKYAAISSTV